MVESAGNPVKGGYSLHCRGFSLYGQIFHLGVCSGKQTNATRFGKVIGLAVTIKWDKLGVLITLIGTIAFFSSIGYRGFPYIALFNGMPLIFLGVYWLQSGMS